jgi:phosphoribosylformylglycinamidine synthase subunit PurL
MYSVMWSEHCSYKSPGHLGRFPTEAPWVVVGPGENAGVVDLGDGWLAALRIESHNHPSFVEPYQGAATGVGGILRDVFTMGARPIALWDQIRFGPSTTRRTATCFNGGRRRASPDTATQSGSPPLAGRSSSTRLHGQPAGQRDVPRDPETGAAGPGHCRRRGHRGGPARQRHRPGRDRRRLGARLGLLRRESGEAPSVQVGDPFEEKKLIEACLELYEKGLVVGVQDLGAAGLSCATSEPAGGRGGDGGRPRPGPRPRVGDDRPGAADVGVAGADDGLRRPDRVDEVLAVADKWEIDSAVVGGQGRRARCGCSIGARWSPRCRPPRCAEDAPLYDRPGPSPDWIEEVWGPAHPTSASRALAEVAPNSSTTPRSHHPPGPTSSTTTCCSSTP